MQRREVLRFLTSAAALSATPAELILAVQEVRAKTSPSIGLRTLNGHQDATVTTISELILPETDTPGAKGAKVNEFIDLLLTEWFEQADTDRFLQGLAQIDVDSRKRFGADFIACNASQQMDLMKQFDSEAMDAARARKTAARTDTTTTTPPPNFFYTFKRLTLVGYYTSEIGFKQELGRKIIPPGHSGCASLGEAHP